jgi:hypothetical protein
VYWGFQDERCSNGEHDDPCRADADCRGGSCIHIGGAGVNSNQRCQDGRLGARCTENDQCTDSVCVSGTCTTPGDLGTSCDAAADCATGYCGSSQCTGGGAGERCSSYQPVEGQCQPGFSCVSNECSDGSAGSPCETIADCSTTYCIDDACSDGKVGQACLEPANCDPGLFCGRGTCSVGGANDPCDFNIQCINRNCVDPAGVERGLCRPAPGGSPCTAGDQCQSNNCASGKCTSGGPGAPCADDTQCDRGHCVSGA